MRVRKRANRTVKERGEAFLSFMLCASRGKENPNGVKRITREDKKTRTSILREFMYEL